MLQSEKIAIAAHLHVLLRRKTGRVTDTEWMAQDATYATEIVRFVRANADKTENADLAQWANKLEAAVLGPAAAQAVPQAVAAANVKAPTPAESNLPAQAPAQPRYVWGIR